MLCCQMVFLSSRFFAVRIKKGSRCGRSFSFGLLFLHATHLHTLSLSLSLSNASTHSHNHAPSHTHTRTHLPCNSLDFTLSHSHTHERTQTLFCIISTVSFRDSEYLNLNDGIFKARPYFLLLSMLGSNVVKSDPKIIIISFLFNPGSL
jgi:hypothetical protein